MNPIRVTTEGWREAVGAQLSQDARFAGAWATGRPAEAWRAAFAAPEGTVRVLSCTPDRGSVPTIVDLVPAAGWDEREAHDLHGLRFEGHAPMRPLVHHRDDLATWTTPVSGAGVHQVAVGPIHAGVIESGHFRFHLVGERVLVLDPRLFHKHRGLERAAEGLVPEEALAHAQRACAACAVTNTVAVAQAAESISGLAPDDDLRRARTLLLELERLYSHLNDIGAICSGVGFAPGAMAFASLKDRAQEICRRLAGHRFLFGSVRIGTGAVALSRSDADTALGELRELRADAAAAWRDLEFNASVRARLTGIGVLSREDAERMGAGGPAARAAGLAIDARAVSPGLAYAGFAAAAPRIASGDVAARTQMRAAELEITCDLLEELLADPPGPGDCVPAGSRTGDLGVAIVESPRGATLAALEVSDGHVARMHLRTGSYANWPAVAHAAADNLLPDFPLINKSFELCYACVDR